MRSHKSSKSKICTEGVAVFVAGIHAEVSVHYPGRSVALSKKRLLASRSVEKKQQKSAESIVGRIDPSEGWNITELMNTKYG